MESRSPCDECAVHKSGMDKSNNVCSACRARWHYAVTGNSDIPAPSGVDLSKVVICRPGKRYSQQRVIHHGRAPMCVSCGVRRATKYSEKCPNCQQRDQYRMRRDLPLDAGCLNPAGANRSAKMRKSA